MLTNFFLKDLNCLFIYLAYMFMTVLMSSGMIWKDRQFQEEETQKPK